MRTREHPAAGRSRPASGAPASVTGVAEQSVSIGFEPFRPGYTGMMHTNLPTSGHPGR